jgi:CheY-like chemotaxis protein
MASEHELVMFLMADGDPDDRLLAKQALREYRGRNGMRFVEDGEELMDYLHHRGNYSDPANSPRPDVILLDLNMPRKDGRQALEEIKADPELRNIPVVVVTTSREEEDIIRSCNLGVNAYVTKPVTIEGLAEIMKTLSVFWFENAKLPNGTGGAK